MIDFKAIDEIAQHYGKEAQVLQSILLIIYKVADNELVEIIKCKLDRQIKRIGNGE